MAQRYGGKYSPQGDPAGTTPPGQNPYHGKKRTRVGAKINMLFFAPLPLAIKAFSAEPVVMATYLVAFGTLILAAWLTREGLIAQEAFEARKIARRPALPRKILGSVLTGAGLAIAGFAGHGVVEAAIFAVLGAALHFFTFGPDPLRDKGMDGVDTFQQDRVARVVDEAEAHLKAMSDAIRRVQDRQLETRVDRFMTIARDMCRTVEDDPRDLTAARKYLGVYLLGARDATVKFADLYARNRDPRARADYEALLDDLERNFTARTQTLLLDDKTDLDVEIEVLRERLQRDGVRLERAQ
ncbi:5-bromo-4-chloroindolyl phosphate hydrolysis family protein [Actibacterium ureilyticum]|uniref:5-bromo-4-chloroindolyl phosphate hydrolysis family protein n=1 Tax=Actibacterium ureilyticum TaxID=1590614 RepID=UPI000BAB02D9|nr:5-bromo-4-chloroindolyl phosphate hydrolysis family protein [Actibacterium ureilyticum]